MLDERGLGPTEIAIRGVMPDESPIDLDRHAHYIAVVVVGARRRAHGRSVQQHAELVHELLAQAGEAAEGTVAK